MRTMLLRIVIGLSWCASAAVAFAPARRCGPLFFSNVKTTTPSLDLLLPRRRSTVTLRSSSSAQEEKKKLAKVAAGALTLVLLDECARYGLRAVGVSVPHSLAGAAILIGALGLGGSYGEKVHSSLLNPGAGLILGWMPAFFAPALVTLPLATPIVSTVSEAAKLLVVVLGGLVGSFVTVSAATSPLCEEEESGGAASTASSSSSAYFGKGAQAPLLALTLASGAAVLLKCPGAQAASLAGTTLLGFVAGKFAESKIGAMRPTKLTTLLKLAHPVVICAALTSVVLRLLPKISAVPAMRLYSATAGFALQRLLGASVLSLGCGIYGRRAEVAQNAKPIAAATVAGVASGMYGTALAARLVGLPMEARLALIPRCITSPLALAVCGAIPGSPPSAAVAIVVVTGVLGAAFGQTALDAIGARKPVSRGLAMGAAAHGIGTAQMGADEPTAQPFAAIAMSLVGAASVVCASLAPTRKLLLKAAGIPL